MQPSSRARMRALAMRRMRRMGQRLTGRNLRAYHQTPPDVRIGFAGRDAESVACFARERPRTQPAEPRRTSGQATSRSFCASASDCSFFSDWFSIWRMRSRVTLNVRPTSSSVRGCSPPSP